MMGNKNNALILFVSVLNILSFMLDFEVCIFLVFTLADQAQMHPQRCPHHKKSVQVPCHALTLHQEVLRAQLIDP